MQALHVVLPAWGRILTGYVPALSIEITKECPLRCPGCYAYGDDHLGGDVTLRQVRDFKGQEPSSIACVRCTSRSSAASRWSAIRS